LSFGSSRLCQKGGDKHLESDNILSHQSLLQQLNITSDPFKKTVGNSIFLSWKLSMLPVDRNINIMERKKLLIMAWVIFPWCCVFDYF